MNAALVGDLLTKNEPLNSNRSATLGKSATAYQAIGTGANIDWAQLLQKDPSLAALLAQSQTDQGILSALA